jgi:hypothetical protein
VWSKLISTLPAASAPAASAGRNGRMPSAAAMPIPLEDVEDEMQVAWG